MMSFENKVINDTVEKLLCGEDYRSEVVNAINVQFFDFSIKFFKQIVKAKLDAKAITLDWYKDNFILNEMLKSDEIAIYAGMNSKTIKNMRGSASKEIVLSVAESNFEYLSNMVQELQEDEDNNINIQIKITYNDISVELTLSESLLVINALATKKLAIRGGAWSSIGKKVEKPLMIRLCELCGVPRDNINSEVFRKDGTLDFDREVDFKLYNKQHKLLRCEVKLMGRGNPESADACFARDPNIFVADTLSEQNKKQLTACNIEWLELKNHNKEYILDHFRGILDRLNIPYL